MIDCQHPHGPRFQFLHGRKLRLRVGAVFYARIFRRVSQRINHLAAVILSADQAAGLVRRIPPRLGDERFELFTNQLHKSEF